MKATVHSSKKAFVIRVLTLIVHQLDLHREVQVFSEKDFMIIRQNFEVYVNI